MFMHMHNPTNVSLKPTKQSLLLIAPHTRDFLDPCLSIEDRLNVPYTLLIANLINF